MTTSDPTPPYGTPSPNGQTASDRGEGDRRRRSRRTRSPSELQGDSPSDADVSSPSNALARASALLDAVVARIRSQPHASMAVAAGVGFVLGGALSFRAGRVVLAAATRHVGRELFKQVV
ncbi:MAG TPA: hypothetical protein VK841_07270 [Polyangiaceae bacterium]|jgi:hypothetical protein|nr:hypothetical protein [Polyangiaceae bacterium]